MTDSLGMNAKAHSPAAYGLSLAGFLSPVVGLYASKGMVVLFILASLACLYSLVRQAKRPAIPVALGLSLLALTLWGTISLFWSVSFEISWSLARTLPFMLLGGGVLILGIRQLSSDSLALIGRSTAAGFALGIALALLELESGFSIYRAVASLSSGSVLMPRSVLNNGISVLVLMLWPVCIHLWIRNQRALAIAGFVSAAAVAGLGDNQAATVAIIVASLVFMLAFIIPRYFHKIAAAVITVLVLGTPFAMKHLPSSRTVVDNFPTLTVGAYPRLTIWKYASSLALENPVIGHGLRTSRTLNKEKSVDIVLRVDGEVRSATTEGIPLHPHNGVLQLWLELGVIGALAGLAIALSIVRGIHKNAAPPVISAFLFAGLFSSLSILCISYGLWQGWWLGTLWLQGALTTASLGSQKHPDPV